MPNRESQCDRILALLESSQEVSALELSKISLQYCARISEVRELGAVISNRVQVQSDGVRHGFYKLVKRPSIAGRPMRPAEKQEQTAPPVNGTLFELERFEYPD